MPDVPAAGPAGKVVSAPPRREAKPPGPCAMVIFGAGGDLTKRLLFPALYNLATTKLLPENFAIVGVDIADRSVDDWRNSLLEMLESFVGNSASEDAIDAVDTAVWDKLSGSMSYVQGDLTEPDLYARLHAHLEDVEQKEGTGGNVLFYLAVSDRFFAPVIENLGKSGLSDEREEKSICWRRVVIEKPFGHDLQSAKELNKKVLSVLREKQVFRIDHFLGKETVQNIMAFRFANGLFEPIWNRERIDHVQITVAETVGVEGRGRFYEHTGAMRDMVPNHVFQLVAMTAMEPPVNFDADSVRSKKEDVFASMKPVPPDDAVRGQYGKGTVGGKEVAGYREEPDVAREFAGRDLCRAEAPDRQLAMGGRAVLSAHGQAHGGADIGDRDPVQAGAACAVRGNARRSAAAELARDPDPAGRGDKPAIRGEAARSGRRSCARADGFPLPGLVPARAECRLRDARL